MISHLWGYGRMRLHVFSLWLVWRVFLGRIPWIVLGMILGAVLMTFWLPVQLERAARQQQLRDLDHQLELAQRVYLEGHPLIAVWELGQALGLIEHHAGLVEAEGWAEPDPRDLLYWRFVAHARLARLHEYIQEPETARRHLEQALALAPRVGPAGEGVHDRETLFARLEQIDQSSRSPSEASPAED